MIRRICSAFMFGFQVFKVEIEVDLSRGRPGLGIIGLPSQAICEAKERITSAIINSGYKIKNKKTLRKYLKELRDFGLITWKQKNFKGTNHYTIQSIPRKFKYKYSKYESMLKKSFGNDERPESSRDLEKVDQILVHHLDQKMVHHVDQKMTYKVDEGEIYKEEINEVLHKGQIAGLSNQLLPTLQFALSVNTKINPDSAFEEFSLDTSFYPNKEPNLTENLSHKTVFFDHNIENAKRLFNSGLISQDSLNGWITFLEIYEEQTGQPHPRLKKSQILNCCQNLEEWCVSDWSEDILSWFNDLPSGVNNPTFNAFATSDNLKILHFKMR